MQRPFDFEALQAREAACVADAPSTYGDFNRHAELMAGWVFQFVLAVRQDHKLFAYALGGMKKFALLSYLNTVRHHEVQAGLSIRQLSEYAAMSCYLAAHPDQAVGDAYAGNVLRKAYKWLKNDPDLSATVGGAKDIVNSTMAHANLGQTARYLEFVEGEPAAKSFFFDAAPASHVRLNLYLVGLACLGAVEAVGLSLLRSGAATLHMDYDTVMENQRQLSDYLMARLAAEPEFAEILKGRADPSPDPPPQLAI